VNYLRVYKRKYLSGTKCFDNVYNEVDDSVHAISTRYCAVCDGDFDANPYGNQITLGRLDLSEEVFVEDGSAATRKLCRHCLHRVLGEGDPEEGAALLENSLL